MATSDRQRSADDIPRDLLPIIEASSVLSERALADVRRRVLEGGLPRESLAMAQKLVHEGVLTEFQAKRILRNRPHGLLVGRYVIMERIGSGAMGRVYKAHHQMMDRVVALKIIAPEIVSNARVVSRFQREMRMVGRLDHPNVVRAFDADQIGDVLYIVMEYVPGQSLGTKFKTEGPLPARDVLQYAAMAATGLAHAHVQNIVHRDVKPSNLLLHENGQVKVLDLGLGVLMEADEQSNFATADGIAVGTIDYMSPEQACGRDVDGRSDLFSLGCTMYHLISGKLPYPGETPIDRLGRRLSGTPVPLSERVSGLPASVSEVMDRLLATKPSERFQTAEQLAETLEGILKPRASRRSATQAPVGQRLASPAPARSGVNPAPAAVKAEPAATPPRYVTVSPRYPFWFEPLAGLAARSGAAALAVTLAALALLFGAGVAVGFLLFH